MGKSGKLRGSPTRRSRGEDVGDSTGQKLDLSEMKRGGSGEGGAADYVKSRADSRVHSPDRLMIHFLYLTT
ncbi:hypothetical protein N431DRAFT_426803 [Stipitochalara longipes BDJ]|nr:hypothetical protein N431DRAFT_426803 [Stipitochalara longipes BDJ]